MGKLTLMLKRTFIEHARSKGSSIQIVMTASPRLPIEVWKNWSYDSPNDADYKVRTYRTARVFGALANQDLSAVPTTGLELARLKLNITR